MKPTIFAAGLLLGSSMILGGCGSVEDEIGKQIDALNEAVNDQVADACEEGGCGGLIDYGNSEFTAATVAGKTFYEYGYDANGTPGEVRKKWEIGPFAQTVSLLSIDGSERLASGLPLSLDDNGNLSYLLPEQYGGGTETYDLLAEYNGFYYVYHASTAFPEFYPTLLSTEAQADGGAALFEQVEAYTGFSLTEKMLNAHPWYSLQISVVPDGGGVSYSASCGHRATFDGNGSVLLEWRQNGISQSTAAIYTLSNGYLTISSISGDASSRIILPTDSLILLSEQTALLDSAESVGGILRMFGIIDPETCLQYYPAE